ncbi:unnamed protein product [Chironomus riparius]|uniref:Uncharacterized protein n=1 Tax=Chironomus riparius TaxID=315576 RepID=A0A9N9WWD2_9DIPT|nr:unnamed protein product [Chironomus riparius]
MGERTSINRDPRINRISKRNSNSQWIEGFEPNNRRPRYQEDSTFQPACANNINIDRRNIIRRDQFTQYEIFQNEENPRNPYLEQMFISNRCYEEENIETVSVTIIRNLNLENPRQKRSCDCKSRDQIFLKVIKRKTFGSHFECIHLGEIDRSGVENMVGNDSENVEDIDARPAAKITTRRKSVNIKVAIEDENIKTFLEQLEYYRSKHRIKHFPADKVHNLKRLNFNSLSEHFHFCDPFLDLEKFIEALGNTTKKHGVICKVGSTVAKLVEDSSGYLKIYVNRAKSDLELSNICAVYIYNDANGRNHCERVAVQCGRGLSGIGNERNDFGAVKIENLKHVRLLYIVPIYESKELSVSEILRSNSNTNNFIHIVTNYLLEMSNIESTFCGECNKVCKNKHNHTGTLDVYKTDDNIDLLDTNTLTRSDLKKVEETNLKIHGVTSLTNVFDRYKEIILKWTKYFEDNFLGSKFEISAHEPYFKISSYPLWYQNKNKVMEIKTKERFLKDIKDPSTRRYKCSIMNECNFETILKEDAEKHLIEYHLNKLSTVDLTRKVSESIGK